MVSQLQVLNKVLNSGDFSIITKNNLTADKFFNYKAEFEYLKAHYNTYQTVPDKLTFAKAFPDFDFQEVNEPDSYLLSQLNNDYNQAYLATAFNKMKQLLESDQIEAAVQQLKDTADGLQTVAGMTCTNLLTDTSRYDRYLEMSLNKKDYYISTGFEELDNLIGGIDTKNENMVLAARTGVGKTWTLLVMAAAASKAGKRVGIYSGEMSVDKVGYRLDTLLGHGKILNKAITRGDLSIQKNYKQYIDDLKNNLDGYGDILVLTPKDINGPATVDALQAFVEREHLDILFVDQYSLLEDTSHAKSSWERVGNISKAIKNLQVMKQIPIISVSQMNRTKADKEDDSVQDTTQIGLSDRIGQDATCVIMLSRKQIKDSLDPTKIIGEQLILNVVKSRDGGDNRQLTYAADFNSGTFHYVDEGLSSEDAEKLQNSYDVDLSAGENQF